MSEQTPILLVGVLTLLTTAGALWIAWRLVAAQNAGLRGQDLEIAPDGATRVPVRQTSTRVGMLAYTHNGLRPSLSLTADGIRFKVLREDHWTYAEIERVEVGKTLFGATLEFTRDRGGRRFTAEVANMEMARRALLALPPSLPLGARAAALRDGAADATG